MRMLQPGFGTSAVVVRRSFIFGLAMLAFAWRFAFAQSLELRPLSTMATGIFDKSASEITAYDSESRRLYVVNAQASRIDIFDIRHPAAPVALTPILSRAASAPITWQTRAKTNGLDTLMIVNSSCASPAS